ncbi:MAG: methyl-accepting chemotaxis protein [Pseudomonadota bacterium]
MSPLLQRLRIGPKLLLAPGLALCLLLMLSGAAGYGMLRQNATLDNMVEVRAARLKAAAEIAGDAKFAHAQVYQLLAWVNGSFAKARLDTLVKDINGRHASLAAQLNQLAQVAASDERALVEASATALAGYHKRIGETIDMAAVDWSIATNAMVRAEQQFEVLNSQLAALSQLETALNSRAHARAQAEFHDLAITMGALVLLSIALALLATFLVRRAMLADIRGIADTVAELAAGHLVAGRAHQGRDEIADTARALDRTIATLSNTLRSVLASVHSIDCASQEIASGNLDLSQRTELQAASLEQTASNVDALTEAVRDNAATARRANEQAANAARLADSGGQAVQRAVASMATIKASSHKVVEIIGVIDAIAFQTNILALNAAVEAARAGDQGRGFAVVAAEVRTLAQRSAAAAREIKTLIVASSSTIDAGSAAVDQAGSSMDDIVASVRDVSLLIERISVASSEQAEGIAGVNRAVSQMDDMTQQNAALVEQAAAAAASLHDQTEMLARAVAVFRIDGMPERRAPGSPMRLGEPARAQARTGQAEAPRQRATAQA